MNNRTGIIVLLLVCLGLGVAVVLVKKQASDQHDKDSQQVATFSNTLSKTSTDLTDQKKVNETLEKDIESQKTAFQKSMDELTNNFTQVSENLAKSEAKLQSAQQEIKERDAKIAEKETQNQTLETEAKELSNTISNLTTQIEDTRHKLAASEGDKAFLQKELQRLVAEKTEYERQFNDIKVVRAQVAKLREQMAIARRIEWARQGLLANTEEKGAQRLMQGVAAFKPATPRPSSDLNVEVHSDGSVHVVPPLTNSAPANPGAR